jgi:16S rRNA (adenine1518-N6/adenine1519-N6)-dimethyltransferase
MTTPELIGARRLRRLLDDHDFAPRKRWGQNFVIDPNTIRKVVDIAGLSPDDRVLEVGAGAGSLTLALASAAASVVAVETDSRLTPILEETVGEVANIQVVIADVLTLRLTDFNVNRMVANLPYNLAARIVLDVLQDEPRISQLTVMTQREVGERLAARPGSDDYGQTSVMVSFWGRARVAAQISRTAFWPVPNVDSVVVQIERRQPPGVDRGMLFKVVKASFSQRRKTLRNSLAALAGSASAAESALRSAGIDPGQRAENLGLDGFVAVTNQIS